MRGNDFFAEVLARARSPINDFVTSVHGQDLGAPQVRGQDLFGAPTVRGMDYSPNISPFRMPNVNIAQSLDRQLNPSKYDPSTGQPISATSRVAQSAQAPSAPGYMPQSPTQAQFLASATQLATRALQEAGLPEALAPIMAGIAANETGYGNPKYVHGNNYFGIKGGNGPLLGTWEVQNGQIVNQSAAFREYDNPLDSFRGFISFLRDNPRYAQALTQTNDPDAFIRAVHGAGYATDPGWSTKVINIANIARQNPPLVQNVDAGFGLQQGQWPAQPSQGTSQYDLGLPRDIADAFCAPAGVMEFMKHEHRTPNVTETLNLAKRFGWNPQIGAAGPQSVVQMMNSIGIMAYAGAADPAKIAQEVQAGRPVLIDTPGHYYQVIGANPDGTFTFGDAVGRRHGASTLNGITSWGFGAPRSAIFLAGS